MIDTLLSPPAISETFGWATAPASRTGVEAALQRHSVYAAAEREADIYKWIESEKAGCDLGEEALRQWTRRFWRPFVRSCWLEHLLGERYWAEVDRGDFGLLAKTEVVGLLAVVLRLLRDGGENLDVILWALDAHAPMSDILAILESLDVNSRRLPHRFDV